MDARIASTKLTCKLRDLEAGFERLQGEKATAVQQLQAAHQVTTVDLTSQLRKITQAHSAASSRKLVGLLSEVFGDAQAQQRAKQALEESRAEHKTASTALREEVTVLQAKVSSAVEVAAFKLKLQSNAVNSAGA